MAASSKFLQCRPSGQPGESRSFCSACQRDSQVNRDSKSVRMTSAVLHVHSLSKHCPDADTAARQ